MINSPRGIVDEFLEGEEMYIGGFYSPIQLAIGRFTTAHSIGAGIYATNLRLFIFGHGKATFPASLNKIASDADKADFVPAGITREQNQNILQALSLNRLLEIKKDQITQLELKKPPGFLRTGWLKIITTDGKHLDIKVSRNKEYEWTVRILQAFKPEAVKLTDNKSD